MLKNYLRTAFRNLLKNKVHSFINIAGLSAGMVVAMLIGLWIWDELSFNKYHKNYDRLAVIKKTVTNNGEVQTWGSAPYPLANELRQNYGSDFKYIVLAAGRGEHILSVDDKKLAKTGIYFEPGAPDMLSLKMLKGSGNGLKDPSSVLLSESVAKAFFGDADPMNKTMKINNRMDVKVTGVYEDIPFNSSFHDVGFIAPWELYFNNTEWIKTASDPWRPNAFEIFSQLNPNADINVVSYKIKDAQLKKVNEQLAKKKPQLFLHPMSKWHLFSEFKNGVNTGGAIQYVWLFGFIGGFVLLLACINFMNLSTARSEKRAKEVGIRKAVGSLRSQLIYRFFSESLLVSFLSFILAFGLLQLLLPFFNEVADKHIVIPWSNPFLWLISLGFTFLTGLIAGSYPAFYLSSFNPVKILKGTFRAGKWAAIPRKALVVVQFTVSITMIIGTIIVFRQIQFAKNRPIGYNTSGIITIPIRTDDIHNHFDAVKDELVKKGAILSIAEADGPPTETWGTSSGFEWSGKDPNMAVDFPRSYVSTEYGKTIGWQIKQGRDFSKDFPGDSASLILNETAVKFIGFKNPIGETIKWFGESYKVIGVASDMIMSNPYDPVRPTVFANSSSPMGYFILKINPNAGISDVLKNIEATFKHFNPSEPFAYAFSDKEYAKKFGSEERIGKLSSFFAILAIFISCLGIFGLATFVAEQRTKEIGVRKVLGASVFTLWKLLTRDFVVLVSISLLVAVPLGYYFTHNWLENYTYRSDISWWIFAAAGMGTLLITILTVSFQAIKAAIANPVKSLRTE